jgi:hypothetical protein
MKWVVIIPDPVIGPIRTTFSDYYKAVLFADPLAHIGARIYEI